MVQMKVFIGTAESYAKAVQDTANEFNRWSASMKTPFTVVSMSSEIQQKGIRYYHLVTVIYMVYETTKEEK